MSWIFWAAVILILIVFFVKFKNIKHLIGSYLLVAFIIFLIASIFYVYSSQHIDVSSFDGLVKGTNAYFSWLGTGLRNIGQVTGYAVKQDWSANSSAIGAK